MLPESWDLFLGAGLSQPGCAERNQAIIDVVRSSGLTIFAPQEELPVGCPATAEEILKRNCAAIKQSRVFLFVPDGAGEGVYYELGLADGWDKLIIGYSADGVDGRGKVAEGRWSILPRDRTAGSLSELRRVLDNVI